MDAILECRTPRRYAKRLVEVQANRTVNVILWEVVGEHGVRNATDQGLVQLRSPGSVVQTKDVEGLMTVVEVPSLPAMIFRDTIRLGLCNVAVCQK